MKNFKYILGHAASVPTTLELDLSPAGWNEKNITFTRNETYNSVMRSFLISLRFVREGRDYIQSAYNTSGINALITVDVQALDKSDFSYATYYTGIVDVSTIVITEDYAECSLIDSDRLAKFMARNELDLKLTDLTTLDGTVFSDFTNELYKNYRTQRIDVSQNISLTYSVPTTSVSTGVSPIDTTNVVLYQEVEWDNTTNDYTNNTGKLQDYKWDANAKINYDLTFPAGTSSITMTVEIYSVNNWVTIAEKSFSYNGVPVTPLPQSGSLEDNNSASGTLADTKYIGRMRLSWTRVGAVLGTMTVSDGTLLLTPSIQGATSSQFQAILPDEAIQRSIRLMTGDTAFRSDIVGRTDSENYSYASDGELSLIGLARGYNIRGFTQADKPFITSFKDLFKALNSYKPLGFWYSHTDSRWELKDIIDFYKDSEILDLGDVSELEISLDEKFFYNRIIGSCNKSIEYADFNGSQSFAVKTEYTNDVQRISAEYDFSTVYRTDDYGIHLAVSKSNLDEYSTEQDGDNDNFMIFGDRVGTATPILLQNTAYDDNFVEWTATIPGTDVVTTDFDRRCNFEFAPKRCLINHAQLLAIPMHVSGGDVVFKNSQFDYNLGLRATGEAAPIYEQDDFDTGDYEPLYFPEIYNFNKPVTKAIIDQLLDDPHGYVTFTFKGTEYKGYILEVSTEPFNRNGNWTLIKYNPDR